VDSAITNFKAPGFEWLSNFYPVDVYYQGDIYPSVEHAYQAAKSDCKEYRAQVRAQYNAAAAKRLARMNHVRPDWYHVRTIVMHRLVRAKFARIDLQRLLLATGDRLIEEHNTWGDDFWGVCKGQGRNTLGNILMEVRDELRGAALRPLPHV